VRTNPYELPDFQDEIEELLNQKIEEIAEEAEEEIDQTCGAGNTKGGCDACKASGVITEIVVLGMLNIFVVLVQADDGTLWELVAEMKADAEDEVHERNADDRE
jgi:hypothetical protein